MQHQTIDGGPSMPEGVQLDLWVFGFDPLVEVEPDAEPVRRLTAVLTAARGEHHVATNATAAMLEPSLFGFLAERAIEQLLDTEPEPVPDLLKNLRASLHVRKD